MLESRRVSCAPLTRNTSITCAGKRAAPRIRPTLGVRAREEVAPAMSQSRTIRRRLAARLRHADPETLNTAAKWKSVLARTDDAEYVQELEAENVRLEKDNAVLKDQITPKLLELPELHAA